MDEIIDQALDITCNDIPTELTENNTVNNDSTTEQNNVSTTEQKEKSTPKRKVGRPRKTKINKLVTIHGIVDKPQNKENIMELICHDPMIFKKIMSLLKSYAVDTVEFVFSKDCVMIETEDHTKYSKIYTRIVCSKLYWYYINDEYKNAKNETEIRICVARTEIDDIFNSIDKTYDQLSICINKEDMNSVIQISLHHVSYDEDENATIPIKQYNNMIQRVKIEETDYPIRFTLSTKAFKSRIEKFNKLFDRVCFKKESKDSSLVMEACVELGKSYEIVFNDNHKILLIDNTKDDDITSVEVMLEHIILLAKTTMGEYVKIWLDNNKDILFQMSLSDICYIDVFTQIIENN